MSIVAIVKRPSVIIANTVALTTTQSNPPVELKNTVAVTQNYVNSLLDVVEDNPVSGSTLVYDAVTDKYFVRPIEVQVQSLDGGVF